MRQDQGFTLLEIIVTLIIIVVVTIAVLPNFFTPMEQAKASNAWNNLLAIYTAEQNYNNNYGAYCTSSSSAQPACTSISANCANNLAAINCNLSLNLINDNYYLYSCAVNAGTSTCTASRNVSPTPLTMTVTLNKAVQTNLNNANPNPTCTGTNTNWCP